MADHVVIIGGSSGIGLATARRLSRDGARVTIAGRSAARLVAAREASGDEARVETLVLDATRIDDLAPAFERLGIIDHLVLALGTSHGVGPFATSDVALMKLGFEEKVFAHYACAQAALGVMASHGSITFVAAVSAHAAFPGLAGTGAANSALRGLVPILAAELRPLRVNAVSPGVIVTPWWDSYPEPERSQALEAYAARTPAGRNGRPDDVADAIAFLVGNGFMDGAVLVCDGGLSLGVTG
ncbi:SDR family oxidoreductase [Novosphingobium sp. 1949]|uniref:SDR family oxidoreductase n=1 Tax=Novosphingobium organovorum TaxID=2930092 RepID=A0ABT0B808_9SPHN|nr:SDR family oxidoreductase [Novosphingobium organovorum]MCJ2181196.1 SDR family oxidoreductase [Novosphingobium organovorum]